jgi:hypothetical protein
MINRCHYPTHGASYKNYGGRGIRVCKRWFNYLNFLADMGEQPPGKTLDRIDNNKGYSPDNCRWATPKEQQRNQRNTRKVTIEGKEYLAIELAELAGKKTDTIVKRANQGLTYKEVIDTKKHNFNLGLYGGGGKANGIAQRAKTHCKKGHPFSPENTHITPEGWRSCRTCARLKVQRQREARRLLENRPVKVPWWQR